MGNMRQQPKWFWQGQKGNLRDAQRKIQEASALGCPEPTLGTRASVLHSFSNCCYTASHLLYQCTYQAHEFQHAYSHWSGLLWISSHFIRCHFKRTNLWQFPLSLYSGYFILVWQKEIKFMYYKKLRSRYETFPETQNKWHRKPEDNWKPVLLY